MEATGNAAAAAEVVSPHAGWVVIANPGQVRLTVHARTKTEEIDATVLAKLFGSAPILEVRVPDACARTSRRRVMRRDRTVHQRMRLRTATRSVLRAHPAP